MPGDAKYWVGICWVSSMIDNWKDKLEDIVELPFCYCLHDKDKAEDFEDHAGDPRHEHIHLILCWPNTTTYKNALRAFNDLSKPGKQCCNKCERIKSMRKKYEYLIHNTKKAKEQGKHQYDPSERIEGNNFDIGLFEQHSQEEKSIIRKELALFIVDNRLQSYTRFYMAVLAMKDDFKEEVASSYVSFFSGLCRGYREEYKDMEEKAKAAKNAKEADKALTDLVRYDDPTKGVLYHDS